ncbi:MAG TPA: hypothetical protein VIS71_05650 [Terrimicrobium sp.]
MERVISISEILGTIQDGTVEICATADANYDSTKEKVSIVLDVFARRVAAHGDGQRIAEEWLPLGEHVTEDVAREEVVPVAKDVFRNWTTKVRRLVPPELHLKS